MRVLLWSVALLTALIVLSCLWIGRYLFLDSPPWRINTLPPDEELIANFHEHREDIEELVRRYRNYVPPPSKQHHEWATLGDTPEIFKRAGVKRLIEVLPLWLPDPYSAEARQRDGGRVTDWREKSMYQALAIRPLDTRFYRNLVWKDLVFIPVVPRIENGIMLGPVDERGVNIMSLRVVPTLNKEPPDVGRDTCALRKIESQWFVMMCRTIY